METTMKESVITSVANEVKNGSFESLTYVKAADMNKGGRSGANTLYGRVTKVVRVTGLQFGVDYEHKMESLTGQTFDSQSMSGLDWVVFPIIARSRKNGKLLLRATTTNNTKFETRYIVDGTRLATPEEIEQINFYTPKKGKLIVFNVYLEKILSWRVGGKTFVDTDMLASLAPIMGAEVSA